MSPAQSPASLLDRHLVIVTGKGGTGKSSVSAALALAAQARGLRVLAAELSEDEVLPRLIAGQREPVGYAGRELRPGLRVMRIDPFSALAEYLGLQIRVPGLIERVLANRGFRQLMEASPGWRELITLGKVWHLDSLREADGRRCWDLVVVDAPATGHGVAFLNVPRVVASAVRSGPLRRHAAAVEALLEDPARTLLLPVTLAEELPVRETLQLVARVQSEVGMAIDRIVVNALWPEPFPPGLAGLDVSLASLPREQRIGGLPSLGALADCAAFLGARRRLQLEQEDELRRGCDLPLIELPYVAGLAGDPAGLARLGEILLAGTGAAR